MAFYVLLFIVMAISKHNDNWIIPYDVDNYRYALSALIQAIAGLAAIIITSTFVAIQLMHNQSQMSVGVFPWYIFIGFFISVLIPIIWDTYALLNLQTAVDFKTRVNLTAVVYLNIIPFLITFLYFFEVKRVASAKHIGDLLVISAASCKSLDKANSIILAFEELICTALKSSSVACVDQLQDDFLETLRILEDNLKSNEIQEGIFYDREYPFRKAPEVIERVISRMLDSDSGNLIPRWGSAIEILTHQNIYTEKSYASELAKTTATIIKKILDTRNADVADLFISKIVIKSKGNFGDSAKLAIFSAISDQLIIYPIETTAKEVFADMVFSISFCLNGDPILSNPEFPKTIKQILSKYTRRFGVKDGNDETELTLNELLAN